MLGMLGMHGTHAANIAMQRCDLLIAVGVRFSDRALGNAATFAAQAKVLHIDIDRAEINKNVSTTLHITGDARVVLELLLAARWSRRITRTVDAAGAQHDGGVFERRTV